MDKHFPHLTVGQTLEFAAACRMPEHRLNGLSPKEYIDITTRIIMAVCGLSHTYDTKVGDEFIRGVSGGERKRVSISEMILAGAPLGAWDNATRGLDSATALKYVQTLRLAADYGGSCHAVAIYQASQSIYDLFDKAAVLYEGRQIYFGPANKAKAYFEKMGWECPARQVTGDFLTSITNPCERRARPGMEMIVPRTAEEFERYWHRSEEYFSLIDEVEAHKKDLPRDSAAPMRQQKIARQAKHARANSPYILTVTQQARLTTKRAYQRLWGNRAAPVAQTVMQIIVSLILGSVFYDTPNTTDGFYAKASVLFQALLLCALTTMSEIVELYASRPVIQKQASYAFYHPFTEAMAGILADIPIRLVTSTVFNVILYFMSNLRREPENFFLFFLVNFMTIFIMASTFRTLAAVSSAPAQAMAFAGIVVLCLVVYTGFIIPVPLMHDWFSWIRWINPVHYGFEILVANEFHGRNFPCASVIPPYSPPVGDSWICATVGAVPGEDFVSGDAYIEATYGYSYDHVTRNLGILCGFLFGFIGMYLLAVENKTAAGGTAEKLVFRRGRVPAAFQQAAGEKPLVTKDLTKNASEDEASTVAPALAPQRDIFTWKDLVYEVPVKDGTRRLLDDVNGWVKPGTLTALMGVSGAGKTTLLDVLANRTTMGVITGDMLVNGRPLDNSFQRKTGYVQQQDVHLDTATVRESLQFSATLRQPKHVSIQEKHAYVEQVIDLLDMREFADAVVGQTGEGLNVEQRKLVSIGVELAAKPKLLLFLDEPTSGLDSQSSWAICAFLRKLADAGQAILCTVHQPSAVLFQQFDRLLFLARGGKTVYFGDIGKESRILLSYFEGHGARTCTEMENPAEYMLEIVNEGTNSKGEEWHEVWNASEEKQAVLAELDRIHAEKADDSEEEFGVGANDEFAMPFASQLWYVMRRVNSQYWRMPGYVFAKIILGIGAALFTGFSFFDPPATMAGMQNVLFGVFMVLTIFQALVQQVCFPLH